MKLRYILSSLYLLTIPAALYGAPAYTSSIYITSTSTSDHQPQPTFKGKYNNHGHDIQNIKINENNQPPVLSNLNQKPLYSIDKNIYGIKGKVRDIPRLVLKNKLEHEFQSSGKHTKQTLIERLMQNNKRGEDYNNKHIIINVGRQSKTNYQYGRRNFLKALLRDVRNKTNARLEVANEDIQNKRNSALSTTQYARISSEQEARQAAQDSESKSSSLDFNKVQTVVVMNGEKSVTSTLTPSSATSLGSSTSVSTTSSTKFTVLTISASKLSSVTLLGLTTSASTPSSTTLPGLTTSASTPSSATLLGLTTSASTPSSATLLGLTTSASTPYSTISIGTSTSTPSSTTLPRLTTSASTPSITTSLGLITSKTSLFTSSQLMSSMLTSSTVRQTSTSSLPLSSTPSYRTSSSVLFSLFNSSIFINIPSKTEESSRSTFSVDSQSPSTIALSSVLKLSATSSTFSSGDIQPSSTAHSALLTSSSLSDLSHSRFLDLSEALSAAATTKTTKSTLSSSP